MFWELVNKSKEIADKVTNAVMNYSEVELKVREATSDESWGPHGQLLQQLAELTFRHSTYSELMTCLWRRLHPENKRNWRRIYKSLLLLDHLLKNGSEHVAHGAREHIYDIRTLENYKCIDEYGKDHGLNVRLRVKEIVNLLQDRELLKKESSKAKANRHRYTGYGTSAEWSTYGRADYDPPYSHDRIEDHYQSGYESNRDRDRSYSPEPNYASRRDQFHDKKGESTLGNIDDWTLGKERGVIDNVVEQIKEAWDFTKVSALDALSRRNSSMEHSTSVVDTPAWHPSDFRHNDSDNFRNHTYPRRPSITMNDDFRLPSPVQNGKTAIDKPQTQTKQEILPSPTVSQSPPADLLGDLLETTDQSAAPSCDLLDFPSSNTTSAWPSNAGTTTATSRSDWPSGGDVSNQPNPAPSWDLNDDFGEFVQSSVVSPPAHTTMAPVQLNPSQLFPSSHVSPNVFLATGNLPSSAKAPHTNFFTMPATVPTLVPNTLSPMNPITPIEPISTAEVKPTNKTPKKPLSNTWKELDTLGINLDSLVMHDKGTERAAPTLSQLQQKAAVSPTHPTNFTTPSSFCTSPGNRTGINPVNNCGFFT